MGAGQQQNQMNMTNTTLNFTVGSNLDLESISDKFLNNLCSELMGYTESQDMILSHPKKDDIPVQVDPGDRYFVSLQQGNAKVSFETRVIEVLTSPYPHLHTTYPDVIRTGSFRKDNRVPAPQTEMHLVLDSGETYLPISICNISVSGARLVSERLLGTINSQFQIDIQAGVGQPPVRVGCMIRHIQETTEHGLPSFHHGVEFIGMDAEVQLFLWKFFQASLSMHQQKASD